MTRMFLGIPMWADEERDEMGAGKALLCALQRDLCQAGFTVREDVDSWDDYGSSLVVEHEGTSIWCMVQPFGRLADPMLAAKRLHRPAEGPRCRPAAPRSDGCHPLGAVAAAAP